MTNIDEYIAAYDGEIKERMIALRALIHSCHPDITEKIAWGIPTFVLKGNLVHFSAEKKHMSFHPGKEAIDAFSDRFGKLSPHQKHPALTIQPAHTLGTAPGDGGILRAGAFEIGSTINL